MLSKNLPFSLGPVLCVAAGLFAIFTTQAIGQDAPAVRVDSIQIKGVPEDWTHHHVVFSDPGTEQEAIRVGRHDQWQTVVNDPRYVVQQLRKNLPVRGPAGVDAAYRERLISESRGRGNDATGRWEDYRSESRFGEGPWRGGNRWKNPQNASDPIKRDWSMPLGGPGLAAGHYPAKFASTFSSTIANCSDFVVYPTGAAGTASQATIVAFNNVYVGASGGCQTSLPSVYWAYNTGGTSRLSPVISPDGSQIAYIQTASSIASLVILHMASSGGVYNSPATITSLTNAQYRTCNAGSPPCYTTITLNGSPNDTNSAPFYVYSGASSDTLYVGDNAGKLHKFTGIFAGTPAETTTGGWPATASTTGTPALSSPVYDSGTSNIIFVTDAAGYLHAVNATTPGTVTTSGQLEHGTTSFGPPIVDSTTELVYTFIGYSGDTNNPSYINRFPAGTSLGQAGTGTGGSGYGTGINYANNGAANPATSFMAAGDFDNTYYTGNGTTGHLYTCENGRVYVIPLGANFTSANVTTFSTPVSAIGTAAACSPVTEFLGVKVGTTLSATIAASGAVTVTVPSTTGIAIGDYIQIESEIMLVATVPTGTTFTVAAGGRAQNGTTAAAHNTLNVAVKDLRDGLFFSVAGNGNSTGCTGACVYTYNVISSPATGTPTAGLLEAGGTSGITVDNQSTAQTGAQQIYFSTLTGNTAVQASQAALQ